MCDDAETIPINESKVFSSNNYIYVYSKLPEDRKFVSTLDWQEFFEGQPLPPGLHVEMDIKTGKKYAKRIAENEKPPQTKPEFERAQTLNEKLKTNKAEEPFKNVKKYAKNRSPTIFCQNCNLKIDNLEDHFKKFVICRQTSDRNLSKKQEYNGNKNCVKKTKESKFKEKCLSCEREFLNLKLHLTKSFSCQNANKIDELINNLDSSSSLNNEEKIENQEEKCSCCGRVFKSILMHLKKSTKCQSSYNMEDLEEQRKRKNRKR